MRVQLIIYVCLKDVSVSASTLYCEFELLQPIASAPYGHLNYYEVIVVRCGSPITASCVQSQVFGSDMLLDSSTCTQYVTSHS